MLLRYSLRSAGLGSLIAAVVEVVSPVKWRDYFLTFLKNGSHLKAIKEKEKLGNSVSTGTAWRSWRTSNRWEILERTGAGGTGNKSVKFCSVICTVEQIHFL